jgi:hypothetical protein
MKETRLTATGTLAEFGKERLKDGSHLSESRTPQGKKRFGIFSEGATSTQEQLL